ncbi:MAG: hypothetical protein SGCHY_001979, partial [Lobulomycetales sp.]
IEHPQDILQRGQSVWVKVVSISGSRIGLSLKDVDQGITFSSLTVSIDTGSDLAPHMNGDIQSDRTSRRTVRNPDQPSVGSGANSTPLGGSASGAGSSAASTAVGGEADEARRQKSFKRLTSPERFEIKQLIASGVLHSKDYPELNQEDIVGDALSYEPTEEAFDIEITQVCAADRLSLIYTQVEPLFLMGQTKTSITLSPIKIVKNPDGSMNRAALSGASLAKERREIRSQQAMEENAGEEAGRAGDSFNDPMANRELNATNEGSIGSHLPRKAAVLPEWKKSTFNATTSFGKITSLSMREQRESLPIFKLRSTIIKAVDDNQVLIVVGDTGSGKVCVARL